MSVQAGRPGYESGVPAPERRAFFDLRRRLGVIESLLGIGNGDAPSGALDEVFIGPTQPPAPESYELWYDPDATSGEIPWIALPFATGWTNLGGGWQACSYRKVGDMVQLRGTAWNSGGTGTQTIGNLPVGYRPAANHIFAGAVSVSTANEVGRIDVFAAGMINIQRGLAAGTYASLSLIQFSVTA